VARWYVPRSTDHNRLFPRVPVGSVPQSPWSLSSFNPRPSSLYLSSLRIGRIAIGLPPLIIFLFLTGSRYSQLSGRPLSTTLNCEIRLTLQVFSGVLTAHWSHPGCDSSLSRADLKSHVHPTPVTHPSPHLFSPLLTPRFFFGLFPPPLWP